jgi:curli biogenesis system outer membrane secretion channel CsgG
VRLNRREGSGGEKKENTPLLKGVRGDLESQGKFGGEKMFILLKRLLFVLGVLLLCASCATTDTEVTTKVTTGGASAADILSYEGPKARIAVGNFEVKAGRAYGRIGDGTQEMLIDALFKTNRFIVLESDALDDIKNEYELGESGWAKSAPEKGTFETADIILTGAITAFEPNYQGRTGGGIVVPLPWKIGGGLKIEKKEAYIAASIRLVDVYTRRIIKTGTVEGYSSRSSLGIIGGGLIGSVALGAGFESYKNTPMEKAVMIMLENAITEIVSSVPSDYYRYTPEGKLVTAKSTSNTGVKSLGIVGGQDIFTAGEKALYMEDFSKYNLGMVPKGWILSDASVEIAEYAEKKWMRFLREGKVQKKISTSGNYSLEVTMFIPDRQTALSLKYGSVPEISIENTLVRIGENSIGEFEHGDGLHRIAVSTKGEQAVFYIDEKRIYATSIEKDYSENLTVSVKGIDINRGKEVLFTDIKVAEYNHQ